MRVSIAISCLAIGVTGLAVAACDGEQVTKTGEEPVTSSTPAGEEGLVAFTSERGVEVRTLSGRHVRRIRPLGQSFYSPVSWSPDGKRIAFVRYDADGSGEVHAAEVATGRDHILGEARSIFDAPSWSRDGTRLAYGDNGRVCRFRGREIRIVIIDVFSRRSERITAVTADHVTARWFAEVSGIRWSPDGRRLLYGVWSGPDIDSCSGRLSSPRYGSLWLRNLDHRGTELLTERLGGGRDVQAAWSPDGSRIAFSDCGGVESCALSVIDVDSRAITQLADIEATSGHVAWPHATSVVTTTFDGAFAIDPKTRDIRQVARSQWGFPEVVGTSPDGRRIAVHDDRLRIVDLSDNSTVRGPPPPTDSRASVFLK